LDKEQKGQISIPDFNTKYNSLVVIPSIQSKFLGFDGLERSYIFSWKASIAEKTQKEKEEEKIKELLAQIEQLKKQIAEYQAKINAILAQRQKTTCGKFERDLYFGMMNSFEVRCLQEFLKSQGVYPEGLVTGNYLSLTMAAVKRYQASKGIIQTGYFGPLTRAAANQDLGR
jgi:murein L,D-transpeptidase YcbB/YkuD